jgi:hypothetical protein
VICEQDIKIIGFRRVSLCRMADVGVGIASKTCLSSEHPMVAVPEQTPVAGSRFLMVGKVLKKHILWGRQGGLPYQVIGRAKLLGMRVDLFLPRRGYVLFCPVHATPRACKMRRSPRLK